MSHFYSLLLHIYILLCHYPSKLISILPFIGGFYINLSNFQAASSISLWMPKFYLYNE